MIGHASPVPSVSMFTLEILSHGLVSAVMHEETSLTLSLPVYIKRLHFSAG